MKSLGSVITYLRRYALTAMAGVASDEDTDAKGDQKVEGGQKPAKTNGKAGMTPEKLLKRLGQKDGAPGHYENVHHLLNAIKKTIDPFEWPAADDTDSWKEAFQIAKDHALSHNQPSPMDEVEAAASA